MVVTVNCTNVFAKKPSLKHRQMLYTHFKLAKQLGAEVATLTGQHYQKNLLDTLRKTMQRSLLSAMQPDPSLKYSCVN